MRFGLRKRRIGIEAERNRLTQLRRVVRFVLFCLVQRLHYGRWQ